MRTRHLLGAVVGVGLLVAALGLSVTPPAVTEASWARVSQGTGSFTAGVTPPPGTFSCSGGGTFVLGNTSPPVVYTWAAAGTPANALPITDYYWTLTSGATLVSSGTTTLTARTVSIASDSVAAGTYTFSVVARGPGGWNSTAKTGTYTKTDAILFVLLGTSGCTVTLA
jgi:hypothetical protein